MDSKTIRKHKNDVFRLTELLDRNQEHPAFLPDTIRADMSSFLERVAEEEVDLKQLGIRGKAKDTILNQLRSIFV